MPTLLPLLLLLAAPTPGRVVVRSTHYGAVVLIDRAPVGRVPLAPLPQPPGLHLVEATAPGRPRWSQLVFVPASGDVTVEIRWPKRAAQAAKVRRRDQPAPPPPPRVRLRGGSRIAGAWARAGADVDLTLWWRLTGDRLADGWRGVLAGRSTADLAGERRLWRRVQPERGAVVRLDEAWLGRAAGGGELALGRLVLMGPGGQAFGLDGARIAQTWQGVSLGLLGGRRVVQWGPAPEVPWAFGAQLQGAGPVEWRLAHMIHDRTHHLDASATATAGEARYQALARTVDADAAELSGRASVSLGGLRLWGQGAWTAARRGPFEWRWQPAGVFEDVPRRALAGRWGLSTTGGPWRGWADGAIRGATDGGWRQHDGGLGVRRRLGPVTLGAEGRARLSTGVGPAVYQAARPALTGGWRAAGVSVTAAAGAAWIDLPNDAPQWLPHAAVTLRLGRLGGLLLTARGGIEALHPAWAAGAGPTLTTATLGVSLP